MPAHEVMIEVSSSIGSEAAHYARERVAKVLARCGEPILSARVRITRHRDPAVAQPVVVQVNVDVNGRMIAAEATGKTAHEAIDFAEERLSRRLTDAARYWQAPKHNVKRPALG